MRTIRASLSAFVCATLFLVSTSQAGWKPRSQNYSGRTARILKGHELWRGANAHAAIAHDLFQGHVIDFRPFSENGNNQALFLVTLKSWDGIGNQERIRQALFKPREIGDRDGWARTPMEYVAYFLNRKLGMDYVPPVAYRRFLNLEWGGTVYTEGSFQYLAPGFDPLKELYNHRFPENSNAVFSDNRILNVLMRNPDGHEKNLGVAEHWVDGKVRPAFIDFGASMRSGAHVSMTQYNCYGNSAPVTQVRRATFENLKNLKHSDFHGLIADNLISDGEVWQLLGTRDGIVRYFQNLIDQAYRERGNVGVRGVLLED